MADNVTADPGAGGAVFAADDISSVYYPRNKLVIGADGANDGDVSAANPLPALLRSELVDDAAFTPATSRVLMVGATFDDNAPDSVNEGDGGAVRMSARRELYVQIRDAAGNERGLNIDGSGNLGVASHAVTNAGTFAVQVDGSALTSLQLIDDAVYAEDVAAQAADKGIAILAVRRDADTTLVGDTNDYANLQVDANGYLKVEIFDGGGSHTVDNGGTFVVQVDGTALTRLTDIETNTDSGAVVGNGAAATAQRVTLANDSTGIIGTVGAVTAITNAVTVNAHHVTNAGTFAVQVDGNALTALQLIDDPVFADDAAFTIGTSKVMMMGAAVDDDSTDAADEGDAVALRATKERKQRVVAALDSEYMQSGNDQVVPKFAIIDAATSGDNTLVAAVASKKLRVLSLWLVSAGTVTVRFESGASGTALSGQANLVANTGFVLPFSPVGHFETAANTLLNLELSGAVSVDGGLTYIEVD